MHLPMSMESEKESEMDNNDEFTVMELVFALAEDPDVSDDPAERGALAFGLLGALSNLV